MLVDRVAYYWHARIQHGHMMLVGIVAKGTIPHYCMSQNTNVNTGLRYQTILLHVME
jgi:hypothetical protein